MGKEKFFKENYIMEVKNNNSNLFLGDYVICRFIK